MMTQTRSVLSGAYKNNSQAAFLTHTVEVNEEGFAKRVLCNRVQMGSLADPFAGDANALPTCKACLRALRRTVGR